MTKDFLRDKNLQVIFAVTLMGVLGVSSVAPVLPYLDEVFRIKAKDASWVIAVFTLPGVFLMPLFGYWADRWGRKVVLIPALLLFSAAGTACAAAENFAWMLGLRFLQGVGAASLGTLNITLIGDLYSGRDRIKAMGMNAAVLSTGTALYPALGGFLAAWSWRYPFLLPMLGVPVAMFAFWTLKEPPGRASAAGGGQYLGNLFCALRQPRTLVFFWSMLTAFIIIYGVGLTLLPLFMKNAFSAGPGKIGIFLMTMSLGSITAAWNLRRLADRCGEQALVTGGFVLYVLICMIFPFLQHLSALAAACAAIGFAHGVTIPTVMGMMTESASDQTRALMMAVNGMFLRLGQTVGPVLVILLLASGGFHAAFWTGAFLAVTCLVVLGKAGKENSKQEIRNPKQNPSTPN